MRKLYLLTLLTWLPLIVFSQTDTDSIQTKSFPISIVKDIVRDLIRCDSLRNELYVVNELLIENEKKKLINDTIIITFYEKELRYLDMIKNQNEKYLLLEKNINVLEANIKKDKFKNSINQFLIGIGIMGLTYSLIFK
jgi:hypothetical protein